MPRKPRVEYPGACYHIMCRGDRREDVFLEDQDRKVFLSTLGEACGRYGWMVHCYVLMGNHYHLLLETREANLARGMQWFQTTYTARFNARHRLGGHLFQGRYKAVPMDPDGDFYWGRLGDYIHLNPVRAGLLAIDDPRLEGYKWSSFPVLISGKKAPAWLDGSRVIASRGWEAAKRSGREAYRRYLQERSEEVMKERRRRRSRSEKEDEWADLRRGWYAGGEDFRNKLSRLIERAIGGKRRESFGGEETKERGERYAAEVLAKCLEKLEMGIEELKSLRKNDARKQAVVWLIRSKTAVRNDWIQHVTGMGHRNNISRAVAAVEGKNSSAVALIARKIVQCAD